MNLLMGVSIKLFFAYNIISKILKSKKYKQIEIKLNCHLIYLNVYNITIKIVAVYYYFGKI